MKIQEMLLAFVLGEHGASQFTAWSTVSINGKSAKELFTKEQEEKLSAQPNKNSMKVAFGKRIYFLCNCYMRSALNSGCL